MEGPHSYKGFTQLQCMSGYVLVSMGVWVEDYINNNNKKIKGAGRVIGHESN